MPASRHRPARSERVRSMHCIRRVLQDRGRRLWPRPQESLWAWALARECGVRGLAESLRIRVGVPWSWRGAPSVEGEFVGHATVGGHYWDGLHEDPWNVVNYTSNAEGAAYVELSLPDFSLHSAGYLHGARMITSLIRPNGHLFPVRSLSFASETVDSATSGKPDVQNDRRVS